MVYDDLLHDVVALLQQRGRVADSALQRQFTLDTDQLAVLKAALLQSHPQVVEDETGDLLWMGAAAAPPDVVSQAPPPAHPPACQADRAAHVARCSPAGSPPDSGRRHLTVLCCDLVGSTPLSEQLDPEDLREVVRAYQQASATIIARFDGYLAQYQGDALLVYFGYPQRHDDDAQRAVHTGLGLLAMLEELNARLESAYDVRLAVRIGIHTGPVVVSTMGAQEQLALGDLPVVAAGLQGIAAPDSVVVSASTARLLHDAFVCEDLGTLTVPGVALPMAVLSVQAARIALWFEGPATPLSPADTRGDEAERRQLTVMFCDLAQSATLATLLTPDALLAVVQAYQEACAAVVARFDGYIAQYLADGLLVYFGFPHAHEDDAQRAVRTGLAMVEAMAVLNTRLTSQYGMRVAARIGIHTGQVVAGAMGGSTRTEQLAVGATPNVAARVHGLAAPDTVTISATTLRLVQGYFVCEDLGAHALKGVADPMSVARVLAETTAQSRLEAVRTTDLSALVGREAELAVLADHWAQSTAGQGQVVVLRGEAGIGKSRLVEALLTQVDREEGRRIVLRCSPYHTHSALYPIITHLERRLQFTSEEPAATKVAKLERELATFRFPQPETVPLVAELLSVSLPEGRYPPLRFSPQQQRQRTQATLVAWLLEEAERQPFLAVWEDLHWVDPSTLELLERLVEQVATARMLMLLTYRPEFRPPWDTAQTPLTTVTLSRLAQPQVEGMIAHVTRGRRLPTDIVEQIMARTDGIPLFVEELTKTILESGGLRAVNGHYERTGPTSAVAIPETLQDALMARLDRLGAAKRVAQVAAVIGRDFSPALLDAVTLPGAGTVQDALDQLVEAELLSPRAAPPHATYVFKHALIQDAAYQSLLRRTRQQYHQRIAQVLADRFPETAETQPEVLAHHYTEAGLNAPAVGYWQRAGERATQRSANLEAIHHLTKGLQVLRTLPDTPAHTQQEIMLQAALGAPLMATKGWGAPEVEQVSSRARELCQQVGESAQLFPVLWGLWNFYIIRSQLQTAQELGEQFMRLAQHTPDPAFLLQAHFLVGDTFFWRGEFPPARAHLEQERALDNPQGRHAHAFFYGLDSGMACLSHAAWTLWLLGYPEQALTRAYQALTVAQALSHPLSVAWALFCAAVLHRYRQEWHATQEQAEALITLSTERGFPHWVALGTLLRGWAVTGQGQREAEIEPMRQSLATWRAMGAELNRPHFLALLAEACGRVGRVEEGLTVLDEALAAVQRTGEHYCEAHVYQLKGALSLQSSTLQSAVSDPRPLAPNPHAEAEACFLKAIAIAQRQQAKSLELRAVLSLAQLWQQQGKQAEARALLAPIYGWFTEGFDTADLQEAKALLDELGG